MKPPALSAVLVNQRSALAILGWNSKRFIAFVRRNGVRHAVDGRLVIARIDDVLAALGLADEPSPTRATPSWTPDDVRAAIAGRKAGGR